MGLIDIKLFYVVVDMLVSYRAFSLIRGLCFYAHDKPYFFSFKQFIW